MVEVIDSGEHPPPELEIAWQCEHWHTLPEAGGYLDQDYGLMYKMTVFGNVYHTVGRLRTLTGANIHSLTDTERRLIKYLLDEGMMNG